MQSVRFPLTSSNSTSEVCVFFRADCSALENTKDNRPISLDDDDDESDDCSEEEEQNHLPVESTDTEDGWLVCIEGISASHLLYDFLSWLEASVPSLMACQLWPTPSSSDDKRFTSYLALLHVSGGLKNALQLCETFDGVVVFPVVSKLTTSSANDGKWSVRVVDRVLIYRTTQENHQIQELETCELTGVPRDLEFACRGNEANDFNCFLHHGASYRLSDTSESVTLDLCTLCLAPLEGAIEDDDNSGPLMRLCCSHRFHCKCLIKLDNASCPLCRFDHDPTRHTTQCSECLDCLSEFGYCNANYHQSLWFCVECGYTGCGPEHADHVHRHAMESGHRFAQRIRMHPNEVITESPLLTQEEAASLIGTDDLVYDLIDQTFVSRLVLSEADLPSIEDAAKIGENQQKTLDEVQSKSKVISLDTALSQPPVPLDSTAGMTSLKMERLASQYRSHLTLRLAQSRENYEQRMNHIWKSMTGEPRPTQNSSPFDTIPSTTAPPSESKSKEGSSAPWIRLLKHSLHQERANLIRQQEAISQRITALKNETQHYRDLHHHLLLNIEHHKESIRQRKLKIDQLQQQKREQAANYEARISELMSQLES